MKTPITYYGGKQLMLHRILPLIPDHKLYVEPFVGGGAVFFAKRQASVSVINDLDLALVNFYRVCVVDFGNLKKLISKTLFSRMELNLAETYLKDFSKDSEYFYTSFRTDVFAAWAVWFVLNNTYGHALGTGFACVGNAHSKLKSVKRFLSSRKYFTTEIATRLEGSIIENDNALNVIRRHDCEDAFFYCDPPYLNADCSSYSTKYEESNFEELLKTLSQIKGKFLLSSYPSEILEQYTKAQLWKQQIFNLNNTIKTGSRKKEVLTYNYELEQFDLFSERTEL